MYDELTIMEDNPQNKGLLLEDLVKMLFQLYHICTIRKF